MDNEVIMNFVEITGSDLETAPSLLGGDPEAAITLYLESGGSAGSQQETEIPVFSSEDTHHTVHTETEPPVGSRSESSIHPVPSPIPARRSILVGSGYGAAGEDGDDAGYHVRGRAYRPYPASSSHETPREPFRNIGQETIGETAGSHSSETRQDRLAQLFQPPLDIMFQGSFDEARELARSSSKWLMVTIHDPSEFSCQAMNRDLWRNSTVKDLVRENFVFVQFGSQSSEGKMHISFYPIENYPYIGIIDPLTGERIKLWRIQIDPSAFLVEVVEFMDRYQSHLTEGVPQATSAVTEIKADPKYNSMENLSEEEQYNLAIAASLSSDDTTTKDTKSSSETPSQLLLPSKDDPRYGAMVFGMIATVPYEEPTGPPDTITRIQFRFPDGQKCVYRFHKSDSVRRIFESIKASHPDIKSPFEEDMDEQPQSEQEYSCSIWSAFDKAQVCYTVLPQLKNYYRYGQWKDCSAAVKEMTFCMSLQTMSRKEKQLALKAHAQERHDVKFNQRPSKDIWEIRTEPPPNFPPALK
ncbi:hypothetical protein BASA60_002251 [Batrachochytrium salamandrivorans]|nr:hypothetical protein BASA60_002251 [Batrachochytrium salamandrivorans]